MSDTKDRHLLFYCSALWERLKCWQGIGYVGRGGAEGAAASPKHKPIHSVDIIWAGWGCRQ